MLKELLKKRPNYQVRCIHAWINFWLNSKGEVSKAIGSLQSTTQKEWQEGNEMTTKSSEVASLMNDIMQKLQ